MSIDIMVAQEHRACKVLFWQLLLHQRVVVKDNKNMEPMFDAAQDDINVGHFMALYKQV